MIPQANVEVDGGEKMENESEFGKGFVYNLILFAMHAERLRQRAELSEERAEEGWFNAAADHLFELEVPDTLPEDLKKRIETWGNFCMSRRLSFGDTKGKGGDVARALLELQEIALGVDKYLNVQTIVATWK